MNIMHVRSIFVLVVILLLPACEPNALDLPFYDDAEISLDDPDVVDPVEALAWCQNSVAILNPEASPPELRDDLNGRVVPRGVMPAESTLGEWCNPSARYISRYETCIGCDGICIGVEWPLGARTGHYAFACVSARELASSPTAMQSRKSSLCRQAEGLFAFCDYMTAEGWREIYYDERQCVIGPGF